MFNTLRLFIIFTLFISFAKAQTVPAVLVKDIAPGDADGLTTYYNSIVWNDKIIFSANDGVLGEELWISDGSESGTQMLKDIFAGAANGFPNQFYAFGNYVYFVANDNVHGVELWRTDGTADGTILFKDLNPGPANGYPSSLCASGDYLYFAGANYQLGYEIWRTDGTEASTQVAFNLNSSSDAFPHSLTPYKDGKFFFAAVNFGDRNLYISDGTLAGTVALATDVMPSFAEEMYVTGDKLYFYGRDGFDNDEPWVSDGTPAGTYQLKDINPGGSSYPRFFQAFKGKVYFAASNKFWVTDGTQDGTVLFRDMSLSPFSISPRAMAVLDDYLYFAADDAATNYGFELWRTDGTGAGTTLVKDIDSGFWDAYPSELIAVGGKIYFAAGFDGYSEIWVSDGTNAGTQLYSDINPGANAGSAPSRLALFGNSLICRANTPAHGDELRLIALPSSGTHQAADLISWRLSPNPATETLTLEIPGNSGTFEVTVTDLLGRVVLREQSSGEQLRLPVAAWQPGLYQAIVRDAGHFIGAQAFVVERR